MTCDLLAAAADARSCHQREAAARAHKEKQQFERDERLKRQKQIPALWELKKKRRIQQKLTEELEAFIQFSNSLKTLQTIEPPSTKAGRKKVKQSFSHGKGFVQVLTKALKDAEAVEADEALLAESRKQLVLHEEWWAKQNQHLKEDIVAAIEREDVVALRRLAARATQLGETEMQGKADREIHAIEAGKGGLQKKVAEAKAAKEKKEAEAKRISLENRIEAAMFASPPDLSELRAAIKAARPVLKGEANFEIALATLERMESELMEAQKAFAVQRREERKQRQEAAQLQQKEMAAQRRREKEVVQCQAEEAAAQRRREILEQQQRLQQEQRIAEMLQAFRLVHAFAYHSGEWSGDGDSAWSAWMHDATRLTQKTGSDGCDWLAYLRSLLGAAEALEKLSLALHHQEGGPLLSTALDAACSARKHLEKVAKDCSKMHLTANRASTSNSELSWDPEMLARCDGWLQSGISTAAQKLESNLQMKRPSLTTQSIAVISWPQPEETFQVAGLIQAGKAAAEAWRLVDRLRVDVFAAEAKSASRLRNLEKLHEALTRLYALPSMFDSVPAGVSLHAKLEVQNSGKYNHHHHIDVQTLKES